MSETKPAANIAGFRLGKGITLDNGNGSWTRQYIELEVKLPEKAMDKDFTNAFTSAEYMIDQLLAQPQTATPPVKSDAAQVKITMTPQEVDLQPWIASKWVRKDEADRKARPGEDAWVKEDDVRDPRLVEMLKAGNGQFEMPGVYTFEHKVRPGYTTGLIIRHGPQKAKK